MCLAVPMKIVELRSETLAVAELDGVRREIDVSLVELPRVGSHVIVHAGYAIEILDEAAANELIAFLGQLNTTQDATSDSH